MSMQSIPKWNVLEFLIKINSVETLHSPLSNDFLSCQKSQLFALSLFDFSLAPYPLVDG